MPGKLWSGAFSPSFESAFLNELQEDRKRDPIQPTYVLVGSNLLGIHLRHRLAEEFGGHFNVRFLTFVDLAERLIGDTLSAQNRRAFPAGSEVLLLEQLSSNLTERSFFHTVSKQRGFHKALLATFHDLLSGGLTSLLPLNGKLRELGEIFSEHRRSYLKNFYSTADLILEASADAKDPREILGDRTFYVYGFSDFSGVQRRLISRLARALPLSAWIPTTATPDRLTQNSLRFFTSLGLKEASVESTPAEASVFAFSAPGEYIEAEEGARLFLEQIELHKIPLHRAAILFRDSSRYRMVYADVFRRAGLPFYLEGGSKLSESRLGRSVLATLGLIGSEYRRADVVHALSLFPFRRNLAEGAGEPADWDAWTREALVTRGVSSFLSRLGAFASDRRQGTLKFLTLLKRWFSDLESLKQDPIDPAKWGLHACEFVEKWAEPSDELSQVLKTLKGISDLSGIPVPLSLSAIHRILSERFEGTKTSTESFEKDGVFIGSLDKARAIPFDLVHIPGLAERLFPSPPKVDPLLLDSERATLNRTDGVQLSLKEARLDEERALFELASLQATKLLVLSYPRLDLTTSRERLPSTFLVEARERSGIDIRHRPLVRWQKDPSESTPGLDERDWISVELSGRLVRYKSELGAQLAQWSPLATHVQQWVANRLGSKTWSVYDGLVSLGDDLSREDHSFSSTELSTYATCPHRYFLRYFVGLRPKDDPDEVRQLRSIDRGNLVHRILFEFFRTLQVKRLLPIREENRKKIDTTLTEAAEKVFSDVADQLPLGPKLLWETEKAFLLSDLRSLVDGEFALEGLYEPLDFEVRFGMQATMDDEGSLSTDEPLVLRLGREELRLRGRIDRIDVSPDRKRARIIDYKTGILSSGKDEAFSGGEQIQLPVYLLALPLLVPTAVLQASDAILLSTVYGAGVRTVHFSGQTLSARKGELDGLLFNIARGTRSGLFPPFPGNQSENCRACDFRRICGSAVGRLFERKSEDPALAPIRSIQEIE